MICVELHAHGYGLWSWYCVERAGGQVEISLALASLSTTLISGLLRRRQRVLIHTEGHNYRATSVVTTVSIASILKNPPPTLYKLRSEFLTQLDRKMRRRRGFLVSLSPEIAGHKKHCHFPFLNCVLLAGLVSLRTLVGSLYRAKF
jgi:hypothetical protein